jgi:hypothetical protein
MSRSIALSAKPADAADTKRRRRIRRWGQWMARICLATGLLLVAGGLGYWLMTPAADLFGEAGLPVERAREVGPIVRFSGFLLSMIPVAVLVYGLINARRCFAGFAAGEFLSLAAADRLRNFAIAVAASSLLEPLSGGALSVLLSINGLSGPRTLRLEIGSETLIMMIFAGTVAIIAWLMAEAAGLAEENEQFV